MLQIRIVSNNLLLQKQNKTLFVITDRREGRPAQQINVTSFGVTVSADEIAEAKAIVRELVRANYAPALAQLGD
jgi:hypothetical protein